MQAPYTLSCSLENFLLQLYAQCLSRNNTLIMYRLPYESSIKVQCASHLIYRTQPQINLLKRGFILCPFDKTNSKYLSLRPDFSFSLPYQKKTSSLTDLIIERGKKAFTNDLLQAALNENNTLSFNELRPHQANESATAPTTKKQYEQLVKNGLSGIQQKKFSKVVLARTKHLSFTHTKLIISYIRLCELYPNAFVYLISDQQIGTWIGSTPELLLLRNQTTWRTQALAGTKSLPSSGSLYDVHWTKKEREEHNWVAEHIRKALNKQQLDQIISTKPQTVRSGHIAHLSTYFEGPAQSPVGRFWNLLKALHPTPAICGYPMPAALQFIQEQEPINRTYYAGFLGPIEQTNTQLYVNIRCATLINKGICLYAGAGIVQDSNPQAEWLETEAKLQTLTQILQAV